MNSQVSVIFILQLSISNRMSTSCLERSGKKPVSRKSSSKCKPTSPGISIDFHCLDQTSNIRYQYWSCTVLYCGILTGKYSLLPPAPRLVQKLSKLLHFDSFPHWQHYTFYPYKRYSAMNLYNFNNININIIVNQVRMFITKARLYPSL